MRPQGPVGDFRFDFQRAVGDQLLELIGGLETAPLTAAAVADIPDGIGVYVLFFPTSERVVYVGKAQAGLRTRMRKHFAKLSGRHIDIRQVFFKGALLEQGYLASAPEGVLIRRLTQGQPESWQNSGYGSNDPGRRRDETRFEASHFDCRFPARLDWPMRRLGAVTSVGEFVVALKTQLPYTFRADQRLMPHRTQHRPIAEARFSPPAEEMPARAAFGALAAALPAGWQVAALPGYAIAYRRVADLPSAVHIWRSDAGGAAVDGPMAYLDNVADAPPLPELTPDLEGLIAEGDEGAEEDNMGAGTATE